MLGRSSVIARNFSQSMVRYGGHGGIPGEVSNYWSNGVFVLLHNVQKRNPEGKSKNDITLRVNISIIEPALQPAEQV